MIITLKDLIKITIIKISNLFVAYLRMCNYYLSYSVFLPDFFISHWDTKAIGKLVPIKHDNNNNNKILEIIQ